jgi:hypothetical protein
MKKTSTALIISGVVIAAIISAIALYTHFRLLATEGEERGNETLQEMAQEVLTGQPAHSEANETKANATAGESGGAHSEADETPEQRAAEGH